MFTNAERASRYRLRHPERLLERDRKWRENNPEKVKSRNKNYYEQNKQSEIARSGQYYRDNRETEKQRHRNNRHHITQETFDKQLADQDNKCAVCLQEFTSTPHIDHDHRCCSPLKSCDKCRRGLLCQDCNLGIGRFKDNVVSLTNAITYLNSFSKGIQ